MLFLPVYCCSASVSAHKGRLSADSGCNFRLEQNINCVYKQTQK